MSVNPGELPLLLAGPVLRRVESDLVCVWIATSQPCNATLLLFDGGDVAASDSPLGDERAEWISTPQQTLQAGTRLHILAITLDLKTPGGNAVRSNGPLLPNSTYSYDLNLFTRDNPATRHSLRTIDGGRLLEDPVPLGYDRGELPSFVTPPIEREKLVILHGSCRELFSAPPLEDDPALDPNPFEPPGGWPKQEVTPGNPAHAGAADPFPSDAYPAFPKRDGMLWVDALIDQRAAIPQLRFASRPHQLFLTGDQIYADSMSVAILPALNHLGQVLVGPEDLGANPVDAQVAEATLQNFPPGFRRGAAVRSAFFTVDGGASHVFSFGEFIAHYLLTWSPALWALDLWPDDFDPSALQMPEDWFITWTFKDEVERTHSDDYDELKSNLPVADSPGPEAPEREQVGWFFRQRRDWLASKYWSKARFEWWTRRFRKGLPRVRRALANVPTYMLGDDHEVTDDWYFSRQWRERVFTRTLGVDIVRNGLMAYTVMQAWGNDPRRWSRGPELSLLNAIRASMALPRASRRAASDQLHQLLGLPRPAPPPGAPARPTPTFRPLVEFSYQIEGPCHRVLVVDGRTKRRFPHRTSQAGGIDYEGGNALLPGDVHPTGLPGEQSFGLFGDSPMAAALPPRPTSDTKLTLVVTGVPVLGPEGMELALVPLQHLARLLRSVDAESWAYEPGTFEALLAALARYESVVLLSGDIHAGFTAFADYWSAPSGQPVRTARFVQLVSSGLTKDWGEYGPAFIGHTLTHEIFESATTATLPHAERVGWGEPLRQVVVEPPRLGDLVTVPAGKVAHPTLRARLKMRAPVVPTHGWPQGTREARDPNWAWRTFMVRDEREELLNPPTFVSRWTPVALPPDPRAASVVGWHAQAARRMAYGRVFAFLPNVGVVTFEKVDEQWAVRHVLAGELPAMPDTGATPVGLHPFVVHKVSLTPPAPATWLSSRPRIVDDGGWGGDNIDPSFQLVLHALPRLWQRAAGFIGESEVFENSPPILDDTVRELVLNDAADRVGAIFRRKVLRELGPFSTTSDAGLDAVRQSDVDSRVQLVGKLDLAREARAVVRPDLERMLLYHQSITDPSARIDDILLLGCSDWVYEHASVVSNIAGILATFRAPVTRHVPILETLMSGVWALWRDHTDADHWNQITTPTWLAGLFGVVPRAVLFAAQIVSELAIGVIEDHDPRPINRGPVIFTPELALAGLGITLGALLGNRRLTFVSGWDDKARVPAPGTRNTPTTSEGLRLALARQTMSLLIHPGDHQRYIAPARKVSLTMVPAANTIEPGRLFIGWDGGIRFEDDLGGGLRGRIEATGRGFLEQPWGPQKPLGAVGQKLSLTLLFPVTLKPAPGIAVRLTPSIGASVGFFAAPSSESPSFELRVALNDKEDRIQFLPGDGLLRQLLPSDGITLPLDAAVTWSPYGGWKFGGLGELARPVAVPPPAGQSSATPSEGATEVVTPLNARLGPITLHERRLEVTTTALDSLIGGAGVGVRITINVGGTLSLNVKAARLTFTGVGLVLRVGIGEDPDAVEDPIDLTLPNGVAVSLDAPSVSGGGFLQRIEAPDGRVTWRGGLALRFADTFEVAAFGVIEVGGNRPWTLLLFIVVRFTPPYPLAFGLKLTAVGGLLALNRSMDVEALREAVFGTPGTLDAVLFPERAEEQLPVLLPALDRFFPSAPGHQVIGLLVEMEWRADTGTVFGRIRGALLAELENLQFALYGTAQMGFPTLTNDHILRLRAGVEALYDYRGQFVRVTLILTETLVFKRVRLFTGGAALMIRWGDYDEFALTIGGFHPSFRPFIPEGLREPPRFGSTWEPHSLVTLNLQGYVAFTSTSIQAGLTAHVEIGASWGGLRADADFNILYMRRPRTHFELDLLIRVTAHLFGCDLFSAGLKGIWTGCDPWSIEGTIYWEVCGVDMSKDFGPYQWGDDLGPIVSTQEQASRVFGDAIADPSNWSLRRRTGTAVRLRPGSDALDPHDELDVRQSQLPLGIPLEVYDANGLSDKGTWRLVGTAGLTKVADLTDVFPTRRYLRKPPKETPFRGGLACGARFGGKGWTVPQGAVASDESLTEDRVMDTLMVQPPQPTPSSPVPVGVGFVEAIRFASPASAVERKWTRHAVTLEATA